MHHAKALHSYLIIVVQKFKNSCEKATKFEDPMCNEYHASTIFKLPNHGSTLLLPNLWSEPLKWLIEALEGVKNIFLP